MTDTVVSSLIIVGVLVVVLGILRLRHVSVQNLALGVLGAIIGLLLGALASVPLSKLPEPFGSILPVVVSIAFTLTTVIMVLGRRQSFYKLVPFLTKSEQTEDTAEVSAGSGRRILVDTSVIIDGRIADIAEAGFVPGILVVPRFVLAELQNIADSDDAMRRGRGRRGLEVLNRLRELADVTVEISEEDAPGIREVDAKLVALAQRFGCDVLTTDYNLNRVAQIQGVRVLNVNELSNAIRPVVLPGEELMVRVVQPGKERNQGVGYLADGTMIVVENGDKLMGQEVATEVTRVFQTVAGKMIFATPRGKIHQPSHEAAQSHKASAPVAEPAPSVPEVAVVVPRAATPELSKPPRNRVTEPERERTQHTESGNITPAGAAAEPRTGGNGGGRNNNGKGRQRLPHAAQQPNTNTNVNANDSRSPRGGRNNANQRSNSTTDSIEDRLVRGNHGQ